MFNASGCEPIIASIRALRGVLRGAPYQALDGGHLIVLAGLDGNGGVYVHDPALSSKPSRSLVYSMADLSRAWLELGNGTAYILLPVGQLEAPSVPTTSR